MFTAKETRAALAEFVATAMFVWVGCGTAVTSQSMARFNPESTNDDSFLTAVSMAFGLGIAVLAMTIAPISGGHINPAVTFAFVILGKMSPAVGLLYAISQSLGAIVGAAVVWGMAAANVLMKEDGSNDKDPPFLLGVNRVDPHLPVWSGFIAEGFGTFLLVWTVMMTAVHGKAIAANLAPIIIGFSVLLAHLVLVPLTGCGINPARSFGPMAVDLMAGSMIGYEGWWVYYTAPFVGAGIAAIMSQQIFGLDDEAVVDDEATLKKDDDHHHHHHDVKRNGTDDDEDEEKQIKASSTE